MRPAGPWKDGRPPGICVTGASGATADGRELSSIGATRSIALAAERFDARRVRESPSVSRRRFMTAFPVIEIAEGAGGPGR
jgi:hypothetical protein